MKTRSFLFLSALGMLSVACGGSSQTGATGNGGGGGTSSSTSSTVSTSTSTTTSSSTSTGSTTSTSSGGSGCAPALPTFADGKSPTGTLHVSSNAAPGGDGSASKPFDKLLAAIQAAQPGTEVRVSGALSDSTYMKDLKGTATAPIWITGEPGAKIGPLQLEGAGYVVVQDLEVAGPTQGHVLHFYFADHLLFHRLNIHDAVLSSVKASQATDVHFEDCDIYDAGKNMSGYPLFDYVGVNTSRIVRTHFHDSPGVMLMLKGGSSDLFLAWNEIDHQTQGGNVLELGESTGPQYFQPLDSQFEGVRLVAFANLLHDIAGPPVSFQGCKDCAAVHNTIWATNGPQLVRFLPGAAGMNSGVTTSLSEGCRFAGNIVVGGQANGASLNADPGNHGPNNVIDYNVFLKPGSLNWWGDIPQDMVHSTYDKDPKIGGAGVPGDTTVVAGKGPPDLGSLPFSDLFVRDYDGNCITMPSDIGARVVK
jgi:hypothetical protein